MVKNEKLSGKIALTIYMYKSLFLFMMMFIIDLMVMATEAYSAFYFIGMLIGNAVVILTMLAPTLLIEYIIIKRMLSD